MKERLLVMNGRKIVQAEQGQEWITTGKVDKAGQLKPAIYNLHAAVPATEGTTQGTLVHVVDAKRDKDKPEGHQVEPARLYLQVGRGFVVYEAQSASLFGKLPEVGSSVSVEYEKGAAKVTAADQAQKRKLTR